MSLKEKIQTLPSSPGVYLMKDAHDGIIYVGKAKNLKNRVQSYFRTSKNHSPKVKKLIQHLKDFDLLVTDTEFEALLLECQLIKEIQPIYNRMMKNPQSFIYIIIHMDKEVPTIETTYSPTESDNKLYFGPFTSKNTVEKAIQGLKECFKINCSHSSKRNTACLNYSLGLCIGTCLGSNEATEQYGRILNKILSLLDGTDTSILEDMNEMMDVAAGNSQYEAAAKYRDYIQSVNLLFKKEKVIEFTEGNHNIAIIDWLDDSSFKLCLIKRTTVLFSEKFRLVDISLNELTSLIKDKILTNFTTTAFPIMKEVSKDEIDEAQIIYTYLHSNLCRSIIIPENWLVYENHHLIDESVNQILDEVTNTYFPKKNPN
jgi:excinuclease ABC subunit C